MDEGEKAQGPLFLRIGPVPDSQRAPLSNLDLNEKSATLRSDDGRLFAGFTRLVFAGSPGVYALQKPKGRMSCGDWFFRPGRGAFGLAHDYPP